MLKRNVDDWRILEHAEGSKFSDKRGDEKIVTSDITAVNDAGWELPEDIVVVDIDDLGLDKSVRLIETLGINTMWRETTRGVHIYYKKPDNYKHIPQGVCLCGFKIEHKVDRITIKVNGVERPTHNYGEIQQLPEFFKIVKGLNSLLDMGDGGRYNNLLQYTNRLTGNPYKNAILRFINNEVFAEPMNEENFEQASKDSLVGLSKDDRENTIKIAEYLMRKTNATKYNKSVFYYINNEYTLDEEYLWRLMDVEIPEMPIRHQDEVKKLIGRKCTYIKGYREFPIKLPNGVLMGGEFIECEEYKDFTPFTLPIAYDKYARRVDAVDKLLDFICDGDKEYVEYLLSIAAASLITDRHKRAKQPRFHILVGDGSNLKGTLLKLVGQQLGIENFATTKLSDFGDEKKVVALRSKLANIGEDIKDVPIDRDQMSILKNISAADEITLRGMYESAENNVVLTCNLIYSSNHVLKSFEKGESFKRRIKWVPMFKLADEMDCFGDKFFEELYSKEALNYFNKLVIEAYFNLYANGYQKCAKVDEFTDKYHSDNNNVELYLSGAIADNFIDNKPGDAYKEYVEWCVSEDYDATSKKLFFSTLTAKFKLKESTRKYEDGKDVKGNRIMKSRRVFIKDGS